jgi:cytochrome c oxidase cbb3-type subunit 2
MKMTPAVLFLGGWMVFWASVTIMVFLPTAHFHPAPSAIWRPMTPPEEEGLRLYVANGCSYCHTQFVRIMDWGIGAVRIAEAGDYAGRRPALMGTERTGPDLSQEGGQHSDDWHVAHFANPRYTSPISLMPSWEFLGEEKINRLIAYMQGEGLQMADFRVSRQRHWKGLAMEAYQAGADKNIAWLHSEIPAGWRVVPNPYPATAEALLRGKKIYQDFCIGCHGLIGDGQGPAARYLHPPPLNFTTLRRHLVEGKYIGGILYYQIMNGITGTAMPYFKIHLASEKIWDVSNYVAVYFIGYTDANISPKGIDASYEGKWKNTFETPAELGELGGAMPGSSDSESSPPPAGVTPGSGEIAP